MNPLQLYSQELTKTLTSVWNIPPDLVSRCHKHYLLHWSGEYFRSIYESNGSNLIHQGSEYVIIFYDPDYNKILDASRVAISFRKFSPHDDFGFALVRPFNMEVSKASNIR